MIEISRSKIKEYFSLDISHVDLTRLNLAFEHVPHYSIYRRRIRTLLGERAFSHRSLKELLQLLNDLVALCTRDNLQICFDELKIHLFDGKSEVLRDKYRFTALPIYQVR